MERQVGYMLPRVINLLQPKQFAPLHHRPKRMYYTELIVKETSKDTGWSGISTYRGTGTTSGGLPSSFTEPS